MRPFLAVAIAALFLLPCSALAEDLGESRYANRIISSADGPVIEPGGSGTFSLVVANPSLHDPMTNVRLNISIYMYKSLEDKMAIGDMPASSQPMIENSAGIEFPVPPFDVGPNATHPIAFLISTTDKTTHPGYFDQGVYFVRLWLRFEHGGANYTLFSRGYFSDAQWDEFRNQSNASQDLGRAYLGSIGCDGIIPDTSFSVRLSVPWWPLALLVGLTIFTATLAFLYYIEEQPGKHPRLQKGFQQLRGKAHEAWGPVKDRLRKPGREVDVPVEGDGGDDVGGPKQV